MTERNEKPDASSTRPYRMGRRAEQAAATRARILETAAQLLRSGELHDMSIEALAARAGTTRVTVYRAFGTKSAVMQAITWDVLARVRLDRIDDAHEQPDVVDAVREVLYENCRMFTELGDLLPITLELARRDEEIAEIIGATYHGRRHRAMERLARRAIASGRAAPGWSARQIADALLILTSYETLETLTAHRQRSPRQAASVLFAMASSFIR